MKKGGSMKHATKMCIVLVCLVAFSMSFALSNDGKMPAKRTATDGQATQYRPATRQNDVLFVEDGAGYTAAVTPDWVWDSVLTQTVGAGNFGWFGPTVDPNENGPDLATMQTYTLVIWHNYDDWESNPTLTTTDRTNIGDYLSGGGKVWLISQDGLYTGVPYPWMDTYFHLSGANEDYVDAYTMNVQGLDEISGFSMLTTSDYVWNPFWADELIPDASVGCHAVLEDTDSNKVVGIFYPGFGEWQSAFWTVDCRDTTFSDYWPTVIGIATGMLNAFGIPVGIEEAEAQIPTGKLLLNVSPTLLVRASTISFNVPSNNHVALKIYDRLGQHVITLIDESKNAGQYSVDWHRKDSDGADVPNGVYFVRLTCGETSYTKNLVVVR